MDCTQFEVGKKYRSIYDDATIKVISRENDWITVEFKKDRSDKVWTLENVIEIWSGVRGDRQERAIFGTKISSGVFADPRPFYASSEVAE